MSETYNQNKRALNIWHETKQIGMHKGREQIDKHRMETWIHVEINHTIQSEWEECVSGVCVTEELTCTGGEEEVYKIVVIPTIMNGARYEQ